MRRFALVVCMLSVAGAGILAAGGEKQAAKAGGKAKAKAKAKPAAKPQPRDASDAFSDEAVAAAIQKGVAWLFSKQQKDGSWGPHSAGKYPVGPTAIAVYAILESGIGSQDPRVAKALDWLAKNDTDRTYGLALRANVWLAANRQTGDKYYRNLARDAKVLWESSRDGHHHYEASGKPIASYDNSNSQFGVLGIWAADMNRIEVPEAYWRAVLQHWVGDQCPDGGWPYKKEGQAKQSNSRCTMTAGGVATLFVCFDRLYVDQFIRCNRTMDFKPITRGLEYLDKHFTAGLSQGNVHYYLYGVERVGLASGYKYFGKTDWYKEGAQRLLRSQSGGAWGNIPNTAFSLLFLVRGRNAIVFNKLEYEGDWNNRPRNLAGLIRWMSWNFERTVNWQIINLKVPVSEWHDAPILFVSGSMPPKFTDEDLRKLRLFVMQGGTIFSVTECAGTGFRTGIRDVYAKLFPDYPLMVVPNNHDIYTRKVHFDLPGGRPKLEIVSNGVRPLAVHTDVDLSLAWQMSRSVTQKWMYEAAVNIVRYVTDNITTLRPRGTSHWPAEPESAPAKKITLARLQYKGNWDPEPLAYERFARLLAHDGHVSLHVVATPIAKLGDTGAKIAALTGTGKLELSAADWQAMKAFVDGGGTLVVDAAGGSKEFADSAKEALDKLLAPNRLRILATSADVFRLAGHQITKVKYRRFTRVRLANTSAPVLRALLVDGGKRAAVYFSPEDLTAGLVGYSCYTVDGYASESAYEIMRNIVLSGG